MSSSDDRTLLLSDIRPAFTPLATLRPSNPFDDTCRPGAHSDAVVPPKLDYCRPSVDDTSTQISRRQLTPPTPINVI